MIEAKPILLIKVTGDTDVHLPSLSEMWANFANQISDYHVKMAIDRDLRQTFDIQVFYDKDIEEKSIQEIKEIVLQYATTKHRDSN